MSLPEPNPITDSAEERLWNHIADSKQGGDPVGAAFCAAHPATDPELLGLLSLADVVQDTLQRDHVSLAHAQAARSRLAAAIAADAPKPRPASTLLTRVFGRRLYPAYAVALLMLLAALAGAIATWGIAQQNAAAGTTGALCPNQRQYIEQVYRHHALAIQPSSNSGTGAFAPASKTTGSSPAASLRCE